MTKKEPNAQTLEAVHTHTHTCSVSGYLTYKKIGYINKTQVYL